jgi:beta-alanine degradation protein BauB
MTSYNLHNINVEEVMASAMSMVDKAAARSDKTEWSKSLTDEFAREAERPNGCVGNQLVSEGERVRVWTIRLQPGERFGFHRHVLDYFWTSVSGGRGRQHLMDGSTVEYTYQPGETRHETYGPGQFKVHDLENIGDAELVFMTVEFLNSANQPLPIPQAARLAAA